MHRWLKLSLSAPPAPQWRVAVVVPCALAWLAGCASPSLGHAPALGANDAPPLQSIAFPDERGPSGETAYLLLGKDAERTGGAQQQAGLAEVIGGDPQAGGFAIYRFNPGAPAFAVDI